MTGLYLDIGGAAVRASEIIGLFETDGASRGRDTLRFLKAREDGGRLAAPERGAMPRSFIVAGRAGAERVAYSPVTTITLANRISEGKLWT